MKVQVLLCALLCVVAFAAATDVEETDSSEMVEVASFVETAADLESLAMQEIGTEHVEQLDSEGFPMPLTKKQRRSTMEPQYSGDKLGRKKYIVPEYAVPKVKKLKNKKNKPRVFSSHYFSPMPKPKKGGPTCKAGDKKCKRRWKKAAARRRRRQQPLKSIETYNHHMIKQKGFVNPELVANYPGGPRGDHLAKKKAARFGKPNGLPKKTLAPAPVIKFLEISAEEAADAVDTSEQADEAEEIDFSEDELAGREQVTVLNGPEQFFEEGFQAPDWADEEMAEDEAETDESAEEEEESAEGEEADESADEDAAEADADEVALLEEEDEETDESEDEDEESDEGEDEDEEESDEEADDETEEVSLIEAAAETEEEDEEEDEEEADDEDEDNESQEEAVDELAENEEVAEQIDMDATEDDVDNDEEVDEDEEEEQEDEGEAQDDEEAETEANEEAVAEMFEVDTHLNDADTLLAEVDAHLVAHAETESDSEKGTPGSAIEAGMTWEDSQNEKLDRLEEQLAAERAATPKVAAKVVGSTADLAQVDSEHQLPEYDSDSEEAAVETVAPEFADF